VKLRRALLFDVDGVLLDSAAVYRDVWSRWASAKGLEVARVLATCAGRRPEYTVREVAPHLDPGAERRAVDVLARQRQADIRPFPGAARLLCSLPAGSWAIVTSGSSWYLRPVFTRHRLPLPEVQVYGEDVARSKPAPDGYLLAAGKLGVEPRHCLVVEDSPAGVEAGRAAGCTVLAVATGHPAAELRDADLCVTALPTAAGLARRWLRGDVPTGMSTCR
jgi:mannitol-1-/sugar-/sorbitol-6-phosphatase